MNLKKIHSNKNLKTLLKVEYLQYIEEITTVEENLGF